MFVIIGKAGSGKTTLKEALLKEANFLKRLISYTTRKPRYGEVNGVDYHFITSEQFSSFSNFVLLRKIGNHSYAISKDDIYNPSVITILDLAGIKELKTYIPQNNINIIYLNIPECILIPRMKKRGETLTNIYRRLKQDNDISLENIEREFKDCPLLIIGEQNKNTTYQIALNFIQKQIQKKNVRLKNFLTNSRERD